MVIESLVRITGLEPASLSTHEPESCVFANFTISADLPLILYIFKLKMSTKNLTISR